MAHSSAATKKLLLRLAHCSVHDTVINIYVKNGLSSPMEKGKEK